jgi:RNA polymerase sigma-70 factor, ECF subfamily
VQTAPADSQLRSYLDAGDLRRAGTWLVERHTDEVLALCRAMTHDPTAAEDLAQEVFGRAFSALPGFRGEASSRTWLLSIARNRCVDHLRERRRDPWAGALGVEPDQQPDEAPLPPDLLGRRAEVEVALAQLAEAERALVVLRFRHELEYDELAGVFGLREGAVRMRLSRAIARMRSALEPTERVAIHELLESAQAAPRRAAEAAPRAAAPGAAVPGAPPPVATPASTRQRAGVIDRLLSRGSPASPAAPLHPLSLLLRELDPGVPATLRERLLAVARAI